MNEPRRVFFVRVSEAYRAVIPSEPKQGSPISPVNLTATHALAGWQTASLEWHAKSTKQLPPDISVPFGYGSLCFRRSVATALFPNTTTDLEFLPATLDGEDWVILHCLRSTEAFDLRTSDFWTLDLPSGRTQILDVRWINITDPRICALEVFCLRPEPQLPLLCTDAFIDRVHQLGLKGLEFKHTGYIVPDASQAVPKPTAARYAITQANNRKPPKLSAGPLPADELFKLAELGAKWRQRLRVTDSMSPEDVLMRITEELQVQRPDFSSLGTAQQTEVLLGLSSIYGDLLHKACRWSWAEIRQGRSQRGIGVLAPTGTHALALVPFVQKQIQSEAPTATLLFNLIVAGQLPPAEPGRLMLVG